MDGIFATKIDVLVYYREMKMNIYHLSGRYIRLAIYVLLICGGATAQAEVSIQDGVPSQQIKKILMCINGDDSQVQVDFDMYPDEIKIHGVAMSRSITRITNKGRILHKFNSLASSMKTIVIEDSSKIKIFHSLDGELLEIRCALRTE
jgi:hypothetical protein